MHTERITFATIAAPTVILGVLIYWWLLLQPTNTLPVSLTMEGTADGSLVFEASNFNQSGLPFSPGNYMLDLDLSSGDVTLARRARSFGMKFHRHSDDLYSLYQMDYLNYYGLNKQVDWAGIPFATGGYELLLDGDGRAIGRVTDERGIDFHDFDVLPNGNYVYLVPDRRPRYADPTLTCLPKCELLGQKVVEVTPDGEQVFEFPLLDAYQRDDFVMDDMLIQGDTMLYDVTHANSVDMNGNQWLVSIRHTDEVLNIDRETGRVLWRLGGPDSTADTLQLVGDDWGGPSHQHTAVWTSDDTVLLFDNGNSRSGDERQSRAVEYEIDTDAGTATLIWEHRGGVFAPNRGSVQRLPSGDTLINWVSAQPNIQIVTPSGDVALSLTLPDDKVSYQAQWYAGDSESLAAR